MCSPILEDIDISEAAKALWEAPFAVLSHDKFEREDPQFTYANKVITLLLHRKHSSHASFEEQAV